MTMHYCSMTSQPRGQPRSSAGLKAWRQHKRLTQAEAAATFGIDVTQYNAIEKRRRRPGIDLAAKIEEVTKGKVRAIYWATYGAPKGRPIGSRSMCSHCGAVGHEASASGEGCSPSYLAAAEYAEGDSSMSECAQRHGISRQAVSICIAKLKRDGDWPPAKGEEQ